MKRFAVIAALCLMPSLVWATPRERVKSENYGTMRIQAEVFKRLIKTTSLYDKTEPLFLSVYRPNLGLKSSGQDYFNPAPLVRSWIRPHRRIYMLSYEEKFKKRWRLLHPHIKIDPERGEYDYGGISLWVDKLKWITPRLVEVEGSTKDNPFGNADYGMVQVFRFRLLKQASNWVVKSEKCIITAG